MNKEIDDKILEAYQNSVLDVNEGKKLPPHLQKLIKQIKDKEKELEKFGFKITDRTPKGYGPNEDTELNEASEIFYDELDDDRKKLVSSIVGKKDAENQGYFDGIHGKVVSFIGMHGERSTRIKKKDLQKIIKDKNVRWVDISSIGF
jgi:hypothetical protein